MISTPLRRLGASILVFLTIMFSGEALAQTHSKTVSKKAQISKTTGTKQAISKQEYSRNSVKSSSLPDLRKYPSGTQGKERFSGR